MLLGKEREVVAADKIIFAIIDQFFPASTEIKAYFSIHRGAVSGHPPLIDPKSMHAQVYYIK